MLSALICAYLELRADTRWLTEGPEGGKQEGEAAEVEEMDLTKEPKRICSAQLRQERSLTHTQRKNDASVSFYLILRLSADAQLRTDDCVLQLTDIQGEVDE